MPISPTIAEDLALRVTEQYSEAERVLLARIAKALAGGLDSPQWAVEKLANIHKIRTSAGEILASLEVAAEASLGAAILTAWDRGVQAANVDLGVPLVQTPGAQAVNLLTAETLTKVTSTHPRILRSTMDVYRDVIAQASSQVLLGTQTRREAAQAALDAFAKRGVVGFIDKAGRGWDLASYTETATRTATAHAAVASHVGRLKQMGQNLIIVSNAPQECSRCRPWEGKILSISGSATGTEAVATLEEARAAGLFHPNCRHSTGLYQPGVTKPLTDTEDPEGNAAVKKLRYLERQVRAEKRVKAVALDPTAERKADLRIRARQAQIREHVSATGIMRQSAREQIGKAH